MLLLDSHCMGGQSKGCCHLFCIAQGRVVQVCLSELLKALELYFGGKLTSQLCVMCSTLQVSMAPHAIHLGTMLVWEYLCCAVLRYVGMYLGGVKQQGRNISLVSPFKIGSGS